MKQNKTPPQIKSDKHNHVEKPLLFHLGKLGWDTIALMQDLLTGKKRLTTLLEKTP